MLNIIVFMIMMSMKRVVNNKFIKYVFFAILTSIINVGVYLLTYKFLISSVIVSNILAYAISITFAFFINKHIVFQNKSKKMGKQITLFLGVKLISFGIDSLVLIFCHNLLHLSNFVSKIISNCSTTLNNYTLNKKRVFKEK